MQALKWIGYGLAGLLGLGAAAVAFAVLVFDWNDLRGFIAKRATAALNRETAIDGDLKIRLGDPIRIHAEGLRIANAGWSDDPTLLEVRALDVALRFWPLLRGRIEIPEARFLGPKVTLERNREGQPNWQLGSQTVKNAATPDTRQDIPIIERLAIAQGRLRLRDPNRDMDVQTELRTLAGSGGGNRPLTLAGQGALNGKPLSLDLQGGSLLALRDSEAPYPLRIETAVGGTRARIEGTVLDPVQLKGLDLTATFEGPDLAEVVPAFGMPAPRTPPYGVSGRLGKEGAVWSLKDLHGRLGESDLAGWLALDLGGERPMLRGELTSEQLDADDFLGLVGAAPEGRGDYPTKTPGRVLPATPVNLDRLRTNDMDIAFTGRKVRVPWVPLNALTAHARLDAGLLKVDPMTLGLAGGRTTGTLTLDGREQMPAMQVDLALRALQLGAFFTKTSLAKDMAGTLTGRIQLAGRGATTADILASADGRIALSMHGGKVSSLVVAALETDILETLGIVLTGSQPVPFNCIVGDFTVKDGVLTSQAFVVDAQDTTVSGDARINLGQETMNMTIVGNAKETNLVGTRVPVHVRGRFNKPEFEIDEAETLMRGGAAVALGTLLTPLAGLLAFIDPGTQEDAPCARLVNQTRKATQAGPGTASPTPPARPPAGR